MFLQKYQSHTHILTISNGMNMSLPSPCFSVLKIELFYFDDIANLEILPYGLHFSEVMSFTKIIKDVDG